MNSPQTVNPSHTLNPLAASPSSPESVGPLLARGRSVIDVEIEALEHLKAQMTLDFAKVIEVIQGCQGRVVVTGMGKSGIIGQKIAATFSSTGTPALFLHPAEGAHGDLGTVTQQDVVIAISNSGETPELLAVLPLFKRFQLPLIAMTGNRNSTLAQQSQWVLDVSVPQEACPLGLAPTSSTTATLVMGDALAVVLLEQKGFTPEDFALFHPAGTLGKKLLLRVDDLMHQGTDLPQVTEQTSFIDALMEITSKKLGLTLVMGAEHQILGVITDGDIRRALTQYDHPQSVPITQMMSRSPKTITQGALAATALTQMETHRITALVVLDEDRRPVGVIHLHDILKTGIS